MPGLRGAKGRITSQFIVFRFLGTSLLTITMSVRRSLEWSVVVFDGDLELEENKRTRAMVATCRNNVAV